MNHKFKLGQKVKVVELDPDLSSGNVMKHLNKVGTIVGLTTKPTYSCDYVLAMEPDSLKTGYGSNKETKAYFDERNLKEIKTVKAFAYKHKKSGRIFWSDTEIKPTKQEERAPEFDMEKTV